MEDKNKKRLKILIVNSVTTLRVVGIAALIPIFNLYGGLAAAGICVGCFLTDALDGFLARKWHASTFFGSMYDGLSDKGYSVICLLILLSITPIASLPIILESSIAIVNLKKYQNNQNVKSFLIGKIKTWFLAISIILCFAISEINALKFLENDFLKFLEKIPDNAKYLAILAPALGFEIATLNSYVKDYKENKNDVKKNEEIEDTKNINSNQEKKEELLSLKEKLQNIENVWFNNDFYEKHKNESGLKLIRNKIKNK